MTGGSNFWDISVWSFIITLAVLFGGMLVANMLRRRIPLLRKSLLPSSVLGGFLVLAADTAFEAVFGHSMFDVSVLETLTYHGLGLGFVALALRHSGKVTGRKAKRDVFHASTVTVGAYLLQAVVGLAVTILCFYVLGSYAASGILLPMGFGQGPGQAFNWGSIFQHYTDYPAFTNGASFGLTVAAMGFVASSVGGVFYLNRMRRVGDKRALRQDAETAEDLTAESITGKGEIPLSESMDKLSVQFGLLVVSYFLAFGAMYGISLLLDRAGGFFVNTVKPLIWGFNFLVGTAFAILVKNLLNRARKLGWMTRDYTNDFMLNRISGVMFDLMVVASISAIDLSAFRYKEFWVPLLLICVAGTLVTFLYCERMAHHLFPDYAEEAFLSTYGMLTGTASTGVILLREIDPMFETPASHNLVYQNIWSIVLGAPMLLLMGFVARSMTWTWIVFGACLVLFGGILVIQFREKLFKKKEK